MKESAGLCWRTRCQLGRRSVGSGLSQGARTLLGAKGIATRSKDATRGSPGLTTRSKKLLGALLALLLGARSYWGLLASLLGARTLLGAPGIATRSKDATRGSWHRY